MTPHFGWINDPAAVAASLARLDAAGRLKQAGHLAGSWDGSGVFLWDAERAVLGHALPSWDQGQIGSCVSHGCGRAAQDLLLVQIARGAAEGFSEPHQVCREAIYGGSRVEVGGRRGSYSDGSTGAWAAEWLNKWGVLLYAKYGSVDLSNGYSVSRCKQWGAQGCPDVLEPEARKHPVQSVALCDTAQKAADFLANGYPVPVCSGQGFTMKRDPNGFCRPSGSWPHCMELRGVFAAKDGRKGFVIQNSWGDYLGAENNRLVLASGAEVELPQGCFGADWSVVDGMLCEQDSFAYSHAVGFPPQTLTWKLW